MTAARTRAVRQRLDGLSKSEAIFACLPVWLGFGDGEFDQLPVVLLVDAKGQTKATIPKKKVSRRLPSSADACIVKVISGTIFIAGDGPITVSHTLRFD